MKSSKPTIKKSAEKITLIEQNAAAPIQIRGARTHNLQNIDVDIQRNKLVVVTGVSGSGKSSLTIDTLFAEGQRRYAESLSAYARQFMQRMNKPDVDYILGLSPAIAIEQKVITRTPRSTVGSLTEIYDYLRLLFARIGKTHSPISGNLVKKQDVVDVIAYLNQLKPESKVLLLAPFKTSQHRSPAEELGILMQKGFSRMYVAQQTFSIEDLLSDELLYREFTTLSNNAKVFVLVDRWVVKHFNEEDLHRMTDSIETAFYEGHGQVVLDVNQVTATAFSNRFELDGILFEEPVPNLFSFNNPYGACPTCEGFSQVLGIDPNLVIPDKSLSVYEGAIAPWRGEKLSSWNLQLIKAAPAFGFPIHKPIYQLTEAQQRLLWEGNEHFNGLHDFFREVEQNLYKVQYRVLLSRYRGRTTCTACHGYRLRPEALYVKIAGKHIGELSALPVNDLAQWFISLELTSYDREVAKRLLTEIETRLATLMKVGLGYLTLNRLANSLSGGESQRIQLTRSLGSNLTNSLYILDEPSIGLHPRDTNRLIDVLQSLRNMGNTVVVVEHDEMMMQRADQIIDLGPLASHLGGRVVANGSYQEIIQHPDSLTGKYLSGKLTIEGKKEFARSKSQITIKGARQNNLKNIDVSFPLECLTVVTGVSGSGKTTLVKQILYPALLKEKGEYGETVGEHHCLEGDVNLISSVEMVDQNPIGKSSRSNPVTYIKAWDAIRDLFANQQLSKTRGFLPKHFSFNVDGGRCDTCKGEGEIVVEMQFLADVHLLCESCKGRRFKDEVLEITWNGKNIFEVLELGVDEALDFFKGLPAIRTALQPLNEVGLGYVKLGQSSDTLSGGEAQRVKLASFLGKGKGIGKILFVFDEPTTGLHFHDIQKLLNSFYALLKNGHSIIVIEHNIEIIRQADWVIDLGPEAGDGGGNLVFAGTPEDLKKSPDSITGKYL